MQDIGTCDLCNAGIERDAGYVFYSATTVKRDADYVCYSATIMTGGNEPTGLMHICEKCTNRWVNRQQFQDGPELRSQMKTEDLSTDIAGAFEWLQRGNATGIITVCRALHLSAAEARKKARKLARLLWTDKRAAIRDAAEYWTSFARQPSIEDRKRRINQAPAVQSNFGKANQPPAENTLASAAIVVICFFGLGIVGARGMYRWLEEDWAGVVGFIGGAIVGIVVGFFIVLYVPLLMPTSRVGDSADDN